MDYRKTLTLPDQEFTIPMRAGLPSLEPRIQERWAEMRLYHRIQEQTRGRKKFILHDGPPYTNYPIHIGTAMNRVLKDFIVKFRTMSGHDVPFIPGFDNHGMPIEQAVIRKFREEGKTPSKVELCKACREHAAYYIGLQTEQSKRLGVFGDWERRYASMDFHYEAKLVRAFGELVEKGYIYRGQRPVTWCPVCTTALAEAEVEYEDHVSESIYVSFPLLSDPNGVFAGRKNPYALIWTTTPWTIPANLGVAAARDMEYSLVEAGDRTYLLYAGLVRPAMEQCGISEYREVGVVQGSALEGMSFRHPIFQRPSVVVFADYIKADEGTGLVHTAPGHGAEDFYTGQEYGLDILCPVDGNGVFTAEAGEFAGLPIVPEGNAAVLKRLREEDNLLHYHEYEHQYPHCWRCHTPLIFRATNQWFLRIDHQGLRERMLEEIEKTTWYPPQAKNRIYAMVEGRPDWCVSRQRTWGIPIPAFYAPGNPEPLLDKEAIEKVAEIVERQGIEGWFEAKPEDVLGDREYLGVPAAKLEKETDILDVWFDSGCSHYAVLDSGYWPELSWPADLYIEGSDQHRGWFNTSLIIGCALKGGAPYRSVLTHGFVLDAEYRKMSKSAGNVLEPMDVAEKYGADMLRLWAANVSIFEDVPASEELVQQYSDGFRKVRNTLRFLIANLADYDESKAAPPQEIDRWALHRWNRTLEQVRSALDQYEFHRAWNALLVFCTQDLSAFYMDVTKDRLYCDAADSPGRRGCQASYLALASALCRACAPILPHAMEEVWEKLPLSNKEESVHLAPFPSPEPNGLSADEEKRWELLLVWRDRVNLRLEEAKRTGVVKDTQESLVRFGPPSEERVLPDYYRDLLPTVFKVSAVEWSDQSAEIEVTLGPGVKCERCWLRRTDVGTDSDHPTLCARCASVVKACQG